VDAGAADNKRRWQRIDADHDYCYKPRRLLKTPAIDLSMANSNFDAKSEVWRTWYIAEMREFLVLLLHLIVTIVRLVKPGGFRSVVAESVLMRHQLLILNRGRKRAPNLRSTDRVIAGLCMLLVRRACLLRSAIVLKPSTLLYLHNVLIRRKYRLLFSPIRGRRPGPKGPAKELIDAVVEMKRRNPGWGCPRIAEQIALAFGVEIDKDMVRRILAKHYRPESNGEGPSWLTFLGHTKDSLWSCDLFRCESASLRTHWVLVVMDQFTRRIIGFGVHRGIVDGPALCRMFLRAIRGSAVPKYLSSDHDPLYRFHQWQANLRILEVTEIKTVPYAPLSHPFIERLIGTIRREFLDWTLFWTTADLQTKLTDFQHYYNAHRTHAGLEGRLPEPRADASPTDLGSYRWQKHCRGLYQTPIAA
jgi:transposase InsO family protein